MPFTTPPSRDDSRGIPSRATRLAALAVLTLVLGLVAWHVLVKFLHLNWSNPLALYTVVITGYVLSRFALAAGYRSPKDVGHLPTVAIVVPAFNEGSSVARTIDACMALEYPRGLLELVVIDDGSSDDTFMHMQDTAARYPEGAVRCIALPSNQGKRAAMAAGIRATSAEILVFVDSDSMPGSEAVYNLVQGFADAQVGAISGITYVRNAYENRLTRMQAARYFVSFQLLKSAESVVEAVVCCSGCFAAYRRGAVTPILEGWEHQRFLGVDCTYGDDRALTNMVIRSGWKTIYDETAEAWTDAPAKYRTFFRQQLRWKKSWAREGPILLSHIWRTRARAFPFVLIATIAGLLSPLILIHNIVGIALGGRLPLFYLMGLYLIALAYALFYRSVRNDGLWTDAFLGTFFYTAFSPQLIWAALRVRDGRWGTRAEADAGAVVAASPTLDPQVLVRLESAK